MFEYYITNVEYFEEHVVQLFMLELNVKYCERNGILSWKMNRFNNDFVQLVFLFRVNGTQCTIKWKITSAMNKYKQDSDYFYRAVRLKA